MFSVIEPSACGLSQAISRSASRVRPDLLASENAQSAEADFRTAKLNSKPATAHHIPCSASSASIWATASLLAPGLIAGSRSAIQASTRSVTDL